MAFSPDGSMLAVATSIGVYPYDRPTLEEIGFLETNADLYSIAFSPDGSLMACASVDHTVKLLDVADRRRRARGAYAFRRLQS